MLKSTRLIIDNAKKSIHFVLFNMCYSQMSLIARIIVKRIGWTFSGHLISFFWGVHDFTHSLCMYMTEFVNLGLCLRINDWFVCLD